MWRAALKAAQIASRKPGITGKALRFAKPLIPRSKAEAALRFGPEFLYAGLTPFMAPEGTSLGDRALIGLEDLGIGLGASVLGQGVGLGTGQRMLAGKAKKAGQTVERFAALNPQIAQNLLGTATTAGDILTQAPINMLAPRPMFDRAIKKSIALDQEALIPDVHSDLEKRELIEAILSSLLASGVYAHPQARTAGRPPVPSLRTDLEY